MKLIFRGSRDGFKSEVFHLKCNNKGATLIFIKSEMQRIFGGYTDISWQSGNGYYKQGNENSFIFSLRDDGKFIKFRCLNK